MERLDKERSKQHSNLQQKLEERRRAKEEALKRKQETEMAKELLEQKKELEETRLSAVRKAEKEAILEAIREHGSESSEFVIRKILDKRQSQELLNLDNMFEEERKVVVDAALAKLEEEQSAEKDELRAKHEAELRALEGIFFVTNVKTRRNTLCHLASTMNYFYNIDQFLYAENKNMKKISKDKYNT